MKLLILLCLFYTIAGAVAGCANRQFNPPPSTPVNKPVGQAEQLTPVVVKCATAAAIAGGLVVVVAIVMKSPEVAVAGTAGAATLGGIPLLLQQATAWLPYVLLVVAFGGLVWGALHIRKVKALWVKDRTKLKQVANQVAVAAEDGTKAPTFQALADDLKAHLE